MRIAVISDIHGNLTALEAVIQDLKFTVPDVILHGGDLTHGGSSSSDVVDRIMDLNWSGVVGNTDELLFRPESLEEFAATRHHLSAVWSATREIADFTRDQLGSTRLSWLSSLPTIQTREDLTVVHARASDTWSSPSQHVTDTDLHLAYDALGTQTVVFGHIHYPFIRVMPSLTVINTGSVSLSYDGDPRAAYLLLTDGAPELRRVSYDVEREISAMEEKHMPHRAWISKILLSAEPAMP